MAAEQMLGVVVESVLSQAFSLARERISSAWGLEQDLRTSADQLEMIQALLIDAETKSTTSRTIELWLKKLENAATDAYFLLDEFGYDVLRKHIEKPRNPEKVRRFFSTSNPVALRFKMASKIKKIKFNFDAIFKESERIGLVRNEIMNPSIDIRRDRISDPFVIDSEIVGRNDDVAEIVSKLTSFEDEDDLLMIGIVGMAGQGKTTLAQLVYKMEEVKSCFDEKIWVCVSDDFSVEKILNDMLQSLTGMVSTLTMRQVIVNKLEKELKEKRFLLVLDDVWNEDSQLWSCMKGCLQEIGGSKGSKIIVTTRNKGVLTIMRAFHIHYLGALSERDSWKLFEKIALANGEAVKTQDLVSIGKTIVKRSGGLPLAIKALGGLMYSKRNASEWSKIAESNIWYSLETQTSVMPVVKLSYDNLPSLSLKQCFAYCAIFRKDSIILREELIQQWMAHGLLNPSQETNLKMEDVGNNYFEILLQRSLFQDATFDEFGNIKSCKMHDVVHDFESQASKDRCLIIEDRVPSGDIKAVHLSITAYSTSEGPDAMVNIPFRLRTLFGRWSFPLNQLAECKYLCVLVLSIVIKTLPSSIAKMKYLRYLDISGTLIGRLPSSITKLYNLQTMRLYKLIELPRDFENLIKLRHLYIENIMDKTFLPGISKLTSLRTLPYFLVSQDHRCQIKELRYLHNLEGNLKIYGLENVSNLQEALEANLSSKRNIVNLELYWSHERKKECNPEDVLEGLKPHSNLKGLKICDFAGKNLTSWMSFLDNLVSIRLKGINWCEQIPPLGKFPFLKVVDIERMKSVKCIGNEFYGWKNQSAPTSSYIVSFPSLRELYLEEMPNLEQWSDPSHESIHVVFPVLEILRIRSARKLTHLPNVLNKISSLKKLTIKFLVKLSHLPEGLGGLLSLEELIIHDCFSLVSPLSIQSLQSLAKLSIRECNKLEILGNRLETSGKLGEVEISHCSSIRFKDLCFPTNLRKLTLELPEYVDYGEFPWPSRECNPFPSLEFLSLSGNLKTKSLPGKIRHLPALRILTIVDFDQLESLPEWLCDIPSLRKLKVSGCTNLAHLPSREALQRLTNSCELRFFVCPILKERCKKGSYPEWDKIAHLLNHKVFVN